MLVSILIPCFNAAPWVGRAIESALDQSWPETEVVVLDDGSTDDSLEVIRRYAPRIRIQQQANSGQNASRNRLTELGRGEWLIYLDADDELAPDCVEKKMALAEQAEVIYGTMEVACFAGTTKTRFSTRVAVDYEDPIAAAFAWKFPNTTAMAFRKSAIREAGGWDNTVKNCTDYALLFPLLRLGKRFRAAPASHSLYRQWSLGQAVYQDPLRKMRTRFNLMRTAAEGFARAGLMTPQRQAAYERAAFEVLRSMARHNLPETVALHAGWLNGNRRFVPTTGSRAYNAVYRIAGFATTERLAAGWRRWHRSTGVPSYIDPKSGLPYD